MEKIRKSESRRAPDRRRKKPERTEMRHYGILQNMAYFFRFYQKYEPLFLWLCLIEILTGAVGPYLGIYLPKVAIELVTEGVGVQRLCLSLGALGGCYACVYLLKSAAGGGKYHLYNTNRNILAAELILKGFRLPYAYVEGGEARDLYWKASNTIWGGDWGAMYKISYGTLEIIRSVLSFVLYSTVLGLLSPWMLVFLIVLSLLQYGVSLLRIRHMERFRGEQSEISKHRNYLFESAMGNTQAAKDIRIFGMGRWLNRKKEEFRGRIRNLENRKRKAERGYWQLENLLVLCRDVVAYVYLIRQAVDGSIGAGDFVLYFGAITGFSGFVGSIMDSIAELRIGSRNTDHYRAYLELPEEALWEGTRHTAELAYPISVEFREVTFSYTEGGKKVFDHLNLTIRAGERLAVVGVNGAGKTTLVKLLCGMYEPTEGKILLNGIDRNEFPRGELYALFSAVFQEPFLLPISAGQNLALQKEYDEERAWRALEDAEIAEVLREKGADLSRCLGRSLEEDGIELSGGQEQRFLLARALYKDAPFLVLDEPTAALDPIAESEIYDSYARFTEGKTALFISHRLASTRFSDRVVLLSEGGILEEGTHEELMRRQGAYAKMFEVQSRYYAKQKREEGWEL